MRRAQSSETGPSLASTTGLGFLLARAMLHFSGMSVAPLLQKVVQGDRMVGNGPTLAQPLVPGIFWVEGGHVPQASAYICCGSKGISYFSQFIWLILSVVLFLAPLSLPGPTEES